MISICIIEDHELTRERLKILIDGTDDFECVGIYEDCETALESITQDHPDVVLSDIQLPGMSGVEGVKKIKEILPSVDIIMLTNHENHQYIFDSLCAGACGYLTKNIKPAKLLDAIQEVYEGGAPMSTSIARKVIESFQKSSEPTLLSDRENDVLQKLCEGKSRAVISEELFMSINTVKFHIKNIYSKLHVHSRSELVVKAMKKGWIDR